MTERCIVCVDDERIVLSSLKDQLRGHFGGAFTVETAESGEEGLEVLDELIEAGVEVPVIITDQLMPGMKGEAFLAAAHARSPDTRTILLTGQASPEVVGAAVNRAALYRFIGKPWERADLVQTVREAIRGHDRSLEVARRDRELALAHEVSLRFVPAAFLELIGRQRVVDVQRGDHAERRLHLLFADIRGYTALVAGLSHREAFSLVHDTLGCLEAAVLEHGGFVCRTEGAALLAAFSKTADEAVSAALAADRAIARSRPSTGRGRRAAGPRSGRASGWTRATCSWASWVAASGSSAASSATS